MLVLARSFVVRSLALLRRAFGAALPSSLVPRSVAPPSASPRLVFGVPRALPSLLRRSCGARLAVSSAPPSRSVRFSPSLLRRSVARRSLRCRGGAFWLRVCSGGARRSSVGAALAPSSLGLFARSFVARCASLLALLPALRAALAASAVS